MSKILNDKGEGRLTMGGGPKPLPTSFELRQNSHTGGDIVELILRDHVPLKELIETLKDKKLSRTEKQGALEEFVPLLLSHAKAEQQSLYFALKARPEFRVEGFEGITEHAMAEELAQKINATPDDDDWSAKVKVLAESVSHHIEEEEKEILPRVKKDFDGQSLNLVGEEYAKLKLDYDALKVSPKRRTSGFASNRIN